MSLTDIAEIKKERNDLEKEKRKARDIHEFLAIFEPDAYDDDSMNRRDYNMIEKITGMGMSYSR